MRVYREYKPFLYENVLSEMDQSYLKTYDEVSTLTLMSEGRNKDLIQEGAIKDLTIDVVQFVVNASGNALLPGVPTDTASDTVVAVSTAEEVLMTVKALADGYEFLKELFEVIKRIDMRKGFASIYEATHRLTYEFYKNFPNGEDLLETAREKINDFMSRINRAIGKFVAVFIPIDPGAVGKIVEYTLNYAMEGNVYNGAVQIFNKIPQEAQKFFTSKEAAINYINTILDKIVELINQFLETSKDYDGFAGYFDYLNKAFNPFEQARGVKKAYDELQDKREKGEAGVLDYAKVPFGANIEMVKSAFDFYGNTISKASPEAVASVRDFIDKDLRGMVPTGVDIMNFIISLLFGATAAIQIIMKKQYSVEPEKMDYNKEFEENQFKMPVIGDDEKLTLGNVYDTYQDYRASQSLPDNQGFDDFGGAAPTQDQELEKLVAENIEKWNQRYLNQKLIRS